MCKASFLIFSTVFFFHPQINELKTLPYDNDNAHLLTLFYMCERACATNLYHYIGLHRNLSELREKNSNNFKSLLILIHLREREKNVTFHLKIFLIQNVHPKNQNQRYISQQNCSPSQNEAQNNGIHNKNIIKYSTMRLMSSKSFQKLTETSDSRLNHFSTAKQMSCHAMALHCIVFFFNFISVLNASLLKFSNRCHFHIVCHIFWNAVALLWNVV